MGLLLMRLEQQQLELEVQRMELLERHTWLEEVVEERHKWLEEERHK
jgi:hypothetical protein